uniref:Hypothetical chloroplast RF1 n=1 Tax=Parietochloris pseudoalveolaris TaxID=3102 RepID=A0A097KLR3_9CHLO|nr:hypothetical chloroplast RF1 [Parietochloris pseudoalveolaris]AIT94123.1 hypothetical chloroplast RF1 [Parietochloris pseudoalveolaris]
MSFVTTIKDYIDVLNNLYDSVSGNINLIQITQQTLFFIITNIKFLLIYLISFQWFRDLTYLPVLVPQITTSLLKETFFLDNPTSNFFSFLETPVYGNNKFLIGFLNSFFLSLPISAAQLIYLRRLLIQGVPAGIAAGLGNIFGQFIFLFCVLFGLRFFIIPWYSLEPFTYILGTFLVLTIVYNMVHEHSRKVITINETTRLIKIFFLNFALTWTEQVCCFQYFGNLTVSAEPSILEIFSSNSELQSIYFHTSYLFGLLLGNVLFTTLIGLVIIKGMNFCINKSKFSYSAWINKLNFSLMTLIIAFTGSSFSYYGLDYLIANPLDFVSQDKALERSIFYPSNLKDSPEQLGSVENQFSSFNTDVSFFDRGVYLQPTDTPQTIEDLNYQGEYAWTTRRDRKGIYSVVKRRNIINNFFKKTTSQTPQKTSKSNLNRKNQDLELNKKINLDNSLENDFLFDDIPDETKRNHLFYERVDSDSTVEKPLIPVIEKLAKSEIAEGKTWAVEKKVKQKFYSNPVYKLFLKLDIDAFMRRQPVSHFLQPNEEKQLFEKRIFLANYYDSLRYYSKLPYVQDFHDLFDGSRSYADRVYNQQFKGTLKVVRRLFSITVDENDNPDKKRILKFDQPLFLNSLNTPTPLLHEELHIRNPKKSRLSQQSSSTSPFIQITDPSPFYAGWDNQLRKLVITNRLLPRSEAGLSMKVKIGNKKIQKINFTAWPLSKEILNNPEKYSNIPYNVLFESINNPEVQSKKILADLFRISENWSYETLPANVITVLPDEFRQVVPPGRGGFIWPGESQLKINLKNLLKK